MDTVLYRVVVVRSLNRRARSGQPMFSEKASIFRFSLRDAASNSRAALGKCSRRRYQAGCISPEDSAPGLEMAGEYRCGPGCVYRCQKARSPNHRIADSIRSGGPATSPSPSTADIHRSHIPRGGPSRRVGQTTDARRRKVPWHGLAWC